MIFRRYILVQFTVYNLSARKTLHKKSVKIYPLLFFFFVIFFNMQSVLSAFLQIEESIQVNCICSLAFWTNPADDKLKIFFSFHQKTDFAISYNYSSS